MPTVNFQCGHCRNTMAVDSAYLGKQVRCPHCKQVVVAPAQTPVSAGQRPPVPIKDEQDSIFGEHIDEDLFGGSPKPNVTMPPAPPPPPKSAPSPGLEPTVFQVPGITAAPPPPPSRPDGYAASGPAAAPAGQRKLGTLFDRGSIATSVLLVLVPYAVLVTAIAIYLFFNQSTNPHPFEMLPDDGEPKAGKQSSSRTKSRWPASEAAHLFGKLPANLIIPLGKTLTVGDLQVTPTLVEQKRPVYKTRSGRYTPQEAKEESLILHLEMKNVSTTCKFRPTDPLFDHYWKQNKNTELNLLPYTHILVNGVHYCSPIKWGKDTARVSPNDNLVDEYLAGQEEDRKILAPGESAKTIIVTDPDDRVPGFVANHQGKLTWRVQLRRGLVKYRDQESSRTFVFGVEFGKEQITKK